LWCWLRGDDRGVLLHLSFQIADTVASGFHLDSVIDGFKFDTGRDLTGYEDGTENPNGKKATSAAIVSGEGRGLDGASFVAVQRWIHDFKKFESLRAKERDNTIGRRKSDNKELASAPASSHVKHRAGKLFAGGICPAPVNALGRRNQRRVEFCRVRQVFLCL
jgi:putative iron-dependent peroxidase